MRAPDICVCLYVYAYVQFAGARKVAGSWSKRTALIFLTASISAVRSVGFMLILFCTGHGWLPIFAAYGDDFALTHVALDLPALAFQALFVLHVGCARKTFGRALAGSIYCAHSWTRDPRSRA